MLPLLPQWLSPLPRPGVVCARYVRDLRPAQRGRAAVDLLPEATGTSRVPKRSARTPNSATTPAISGAPSSRRVRRPGSR